MNESIKAFSNAVRRVLAFLIDHVFSNVQVQAEVAWEDLENWLTDRGYTLPQLIGYFFVTIFGMMFLGLGIEMAGLAVGTFVDGGENIARAIILFGAIVGLTGLAPLMVLMNMAKGMFDLVVRGGETCMEILQDVDEVRRIPEKIRQQLEALRRRRNMTGVLQAAYLAFAVTTIAFLCWPTFYGFYGIAVAAMAFFGIITLRKMVGVKGHGVIKLLMAGLYGLAGGAIAYCIIRFGVASLILSGWPSLIAQHRVHQAALLVAMVTAPVTAWIMRKLRLAGEEQEIAKGDMPVVTGVKKEVGEIDPRTGEVKSWKLVKKSPFNWSALFRPRNLFIFSAIAWVVWTQVFGRPSPIQIHTFRTAFLLLMLAGVALVFYSLFFMRNDESPKVVSDKHQGGPHNV